MPKCQCGGRDAITFAVLKHTKVRLYACSAACKKAIDGTLLDLEWAAIPYEPPKTKLADARVTTTT